MKFSDLTQAALLGTERVAPSLAGSETRAGRLLAQLDVARREQSLLSAAALSGLHERAGELPARDNAPELPLCSIEALSRVNDRAGAMLAGLLADEHAGLLAEWIELAGQAARLAPPEALPQLLGAGAKMPELREAILPVLGERGRWLAALNPDWAWVSGGGIDNEDLWHTGERPARLLFLERLRRANPGKGLELVKATWKEEAPEDRAAILALLEIGLSASDEPFLEAALDDKRKDVRRNAAALLVGLPESALVKRMTQRAWPLLRFSPGESGSLFKLKKAKPSTIEVTLPAECDKAMQRDGIEPKPPQGTGERAWWLIQTIEMTPLCTWTTGWNTAPDSILAASLGGEWKKELFEAWTRAAVRQRNAEWAEALYDAALDSRRYDKCEGLLNALPAARRETLLAVLLTSGDAKVRDLQGSLIVQCHHAWSPSFSRAVLAWLRKLICRQPADWQLRSQLGNFASRMAPETLLETAGGWPTDSPAWDSWSKGIEDFIATAQFRADLRAAFSD